MTGAHRARRPFPFGVLVAILLVLACAVILIVALAAGRGEDAPARAGTSIDPTAASTEAGATGSGAEREPEPGDSEAAGRADADPRGKIVIQGTGDVSVDPVYIPAFTAQGYDWAWSGLDGLFHQDDLTVINLECAVSTKGAPVPKEFNFRGDPAALPSMRRAGVEVANLGNNHAYDFGPDALADTVRNVRDAGIEPVGAGRNEREALSPAWFEIQGWTVAVLGFDHVVDPWPEAVATAGKPGTAAGHDVGTMVRAIRDATPRADLVVVAIHWGVELDTQPQAYQVQMGHRFVDAGADVIFGHHSHRLQPLDAYHGRPIFWGLGNFVWPNHSAEGSATAVGRVVVTPRGEFRARQLPARIASDGHPVLVRA